MMVVETLSAAAGGLLTAAALRAIREVQVGGLRKVRVFEPRHEQLNSKFYEYFTRQIEQAKSEICVTGEGFEYKGRDGPRVADGYHAATRKALRNGVHVIRIQTGRPLHPQWATRLKECLREAQDRFHLYILDNQEYQDIASVCVIDAQRRRNVVEFMLSAEQDIEDSAVRVASTGVFIHGRRDLARAMKQNIGAMKDFAIAHKCESEADVDSFIHAD